MINSYEHFHVVGEAGTMAEGLDLVQTLTPQLVTMDISLPDGSGIQLTRAIKRILPRTRILIISIHASKAYYHEAFQAGAHGYMTKTATVDQLYRGLQTVSRGELFRPATHTF